jgi:transposase-like protein
MERESMEVGLASAGTFCPQEGCHHHAKVDEGNIIKFGRSKQGVQRYRCKSCATTFAATRGARSSIVSTLL